ESAGDRMEGQATDAAITARVNAALIADEQLKAGRIDVDTSAGQVTLRGDAPTEQARTHATHLAQSAHGVKAVDNELVVQPQPLTKWPRGHEKRVPIRHPFLLRCRR